MKKRIMFSVISSLSFLLLFSNINAQDKTPIIEITGSATIKVVPDMMKWTINIKVDMDNVHEAKSEHNKALGRVLEILKESRVPVNEIQTSGVRMNKNQIIYGRTEKQYTVSSYVWFTTFEVSNYDIISEALIDVDNVFISNTSLEYSKAIETRILARNDALNAAKKKASEMAAVLGETIGRPLIIQEESFSYYPNPFNSVTNESSANDDNSSSLFSMGTINIVARVKVTFELVNM
jgi:uncharacterized protein YggE